MHKIGFGDRRGDNIRFGVIGATSFVAQAAVIPAIEESSRAELVGLASQKGLPATSGHKAKTFESYDDLVQSPEIDAIYIPLPNALHADAIRFAIENNKHVLCEKPMSMDSGEAQELALLAERNNVILMEAYMAKYHPRYQELMKTVATRNSVNIRHVHASFTGTLSRTNDYRWKPEMGGGSLRDVGVYLLAPILDAKGQLPISVVGHADIGFTGVDHSFSGLLKFEDGMTASIYSSFVASEGQLLEFVLEKGRVRVEKAFTPGLDDNMIDIYDTSGSHQHLRTKAANPYLAMVDHFCDLISTNASPLQSLSETVLVQKIIDSLLLSAKHHRIEYLN